MGKKTGLSVSSENTSQKMFIRNDKINEIVTDSDSDVVILVSLKTRCYQSVSITVCHKESKTSAKKIHPSAAAAAAVEARNRKFSSQNLAQAGRERAGPFCEICNLCSNVLGYVPRIIDDVLTE
jgi:hypothetical protein